jgi:hypothetical protein
MCDGPTHGSATVRWRVGRRPLGPGVRAGRAIAAPHGILVISHDISEQRGDCRRAEVRTKTDEDIAGARTGRDLLNLGICDQPYLEETF